MQMPKHSPESKEYFRSLVADLPQVEVKPMFGSVGGFVNGNMFAGLFGDDIGLKLNQESLAELAALPGSGPFGPSERPMSGYLSLPVDLPDEQKKVWLRRAHDHVMTLPPKLKKPR
jgi:TfoX/Sxy family transcriptional regulator of competence genes